ELIKIVDFGISKINALAATITSSSTVIGTAQYMSPEQARGRIDEIDARTDQLSLALIVYEMLTGRHAFQGENISSLVYQIAPASAHVNAALPREPPKHDTIRLNPRPKPAPAKPSATPPTPQIANCSPNYYVDAQGDKHFKPECFLEKKAGP